MKIIATGLICYLLFNVHPSFAQRTGYHFRKQIIIDHTQFQGTDDYTIFPLLISVTDDDLKSVINGGEVSSELGYDIVFTASDGTTLVGPNLETYDPITGTFIGWVRIPDYDNTTDFFIYMYYGNSSISTDQSTGDTWDASFTGVWHMGMDPSGSAPQILDGTSNDNDGTSNGTMTTGDLVTGQIGQALNFDGTDDYLDVGTLGSFGSNLDQATFQFWVNTSVASNFTVMGVLNPGSTAWLFELNSQRPFGGSDSEGDTRFFLRGSEGHLRSGSDITGFNDGNWHQLTYIRGDGAGAIEIYYDGDPVTVTTDATDPETYIDLTVGMAIGARNNRGTIQEFATAQIDEVRISNVARSADWIKTEFNNQTTPTDFVSSIGTEELVISPGAVASNLQLWLKGSGAIGSPIATLTDRSSNNYHPIQAGSADFATLSSNIHNYNSAINFIDGGTGYFTVDLNSIKNSDYNVIGVVERVGSENRNYFLGIPGGGDNDRFHFGYRDNTQATTAQRGNNVNVSVGAFDSPAQSVALLRGGLDQSTGKTIYVLRDGVVTSNSDTNTTPLIDDMAGDADGRVGKDHSGNASRGFKGYLSELMVYNSTLGPTELSSIDSYLAIKYGFVLPGDYTASDDGSTFTTIWDADMASGYQNEVIAIGRNDASALYQKQSHDPNDWLNIYVETIAADNAANTGTITNDMSFLVIGHDGERLASIDKMEAPDGIYSRFDREWKITNTNFTDTYSLAFEWEEIGAVDISDIRLLVDTDNNFIDATILSTADGLTFTEGSIIVGGLNTAHIPINATSYLTIASASMDTPLPIELISFEAKLGTENQVHLEWETATETNNDYFTLERSSDGKSFESIGTVKGQGNSNKKIKYQFMDPSPMEGVSYYILRQTDFDGTTSSSSLRMITNSALSKPVASIYPNPSDGQNFTLSLKYFNPNEALNICIYQINGFCVQQQTITTDHLGNYTNDSVTDQVLKPGVYFIEIVGGSENQIKKMMIR